VLWDDGEYRPPRGREPRPCIRFEHHPSSRKGPPARGSS
jgi:hypothetical protein